MNTSAGASILILSYNGRHLLERQLPSVVRAVNKAGLQHEIGVVDNASEDGTLEWLEREYPQVRRFPQPGNDFLFSLNRVARQVEKPFLVFLNNDIGVTEDFLTPLLRHFQDADVFSVGSRVYDFRMEEVLVARVSGRFSHGLLTPFHHLQQHLEPVSQGVRPTLYTPGGAAAYDREKFLALGGFDSAFWPIYFEDVDICYRAWKRGWKSLHEPESQTFADEGPQSPTVRRYLTPRQVDIIQFKNNLVFTWKNVSDRQILWQSVRTVLWYLRHSLFRERWRWEAVAWAIRELPLILRRRRTSAVGVADRVICPEVFE